MAKQSQEDSRIVKQIQQVLLDDTDFLKTLVGEVLQKTIEKEFTDHIQAEHYERSANRKGYRNGSYPRTINTRVGPIELNIYRDRDGQFQTELFRRYQRSEQALILSMVDMYINGVSTRKVKKVVENLCGVNISKSFVSSMSKELDVTIQKWRNRPLNRNYPYLIVDARYEDIRCEGVVQSKAVLIVVGISETGHREILSVEIGDSEQAREWERVFRQLKERGLSGVRYMVSDDHSGLVKALRHQFQGVGWQRCQVHFIRNFMSKLSRKQTAKYISKLKDIFSAPQIELARERKENLVMELEVEKPEVAQWLDENIEYCFSVYSLPEAHRRRMKSTNMLERFNQELLRRSRVIRLFPNIDSCLRLFGSLCMEQSEQWQTGVKYLDMVLLNELETKNKESKSENWKELAKAG